MGRAALLLALALAAAGCLGQDPPDAVDPAPTADQEPAAVPEPPVVERPFLPPADGGNASASPAAPDPVIRVVVRPMGTASFEPTLGVTPAGTWIASAKPQTLRSTDEGRTWAVVHDLEQANLVHTNSADPWVAVDPVTGRAFSLHMAVNWCNTLAVSDDDGVTWATEELTSCATPFVDHPKLAAGPPSASDPLGGLLSPSTVYLCYAKMVGPGGTGVALPLVQLTAHCAASLDGGATWVREQLVPFSLCSDTFGHITGAPVVAADGTVYLPYSYGCGAPQVAVSTDGGATWSVSAGPSTGSAQYEADPDMAVAPDGTAYLTWRGGDNLRYVARSRDRFETWEGPWQVAAPGVGSTTFGVVATAGDGRLAVAYLGTRDSTAPATRANETSRWHLFLAVSGDAGAETPTFRHVQVTPDDDPVQVGCVYDIGGNRACRNLGDFMDMQVDLQGRPVVAFVDGCTAGCAGNASATAAQSRAGEGMVAHVVDGVWLWEGDGAADVVRSRQP